MKNLEKTLKMMKKEQNLERTLKKDDGLENGLEIRNLSPRFRNFRLRRFQKGPRF